MTPFKLIPASILAMAVSLAAGCSANSAESVAQKSEHQSSYLKPGAAITYAHNLKSQLSVGEATTFKLTLNEPYSEGQLTVSLSADGDIILFPTSTEANFDMADGVDHEMNISFTANSNGRHYINVQALAVNPSGASQPRIFSLPVQVGPVVAQKPNIDMKTMETGENIIEMEAQEEIK